jgi:drug/metabolite transporter (DMT)-like permease
VTLQPLYTWGSISVMVLASTAANILMAKAVRRKDDMEEARRRAGILGMVKNVLSSKQMVSAIGLMALAFFTLLFALSWADVSLVVPAAASLTFVTSALAAKVFLNEKVDGRRWVAAVLVCIGVALLAQ